MPRDLAERVVQMEETIFGRLSAPPSERERELVRAIVVGLLVDAEVEASA